MGALEVSVNPSSRFRSSNELSRRAEERARWTCAIENGAGGFGTGILINHDLVLTNYHVIAGLLADPKRYAKASCRFDFVEDPETGELSKGRGVALAENWECPWSPFSDKDDLGADTGFEPDRLDYAIIRLAESVGKQPAGAPGSGGPARGWLPLPSDPRVPAPGAIISIWQHPVEPASLLTAPTAMPLRWSEGNVLSVLDGDLRLRHDVQTLKGSSGAACFDGNLNLVALHHSGDPRADRNFVGKWNQAVPIAAIIRHLKANGHGELIGVVPPPSAVVPFQKPVARDQQVSDVIEKRVRAATLLMDRDAAEDSISWARDKQNANRGLVHVLACRHVDSHRNFLERVMRLSLASQNEALDARRRKLEAFLGITSSTTAGEPWIRETLSWRPADETAESALDRLRRDLTQFARSKRRVMVDVAVDIASANLNREKKLVPAVAQFCAGIATADRLQIFVVYYDRLATEGNDKTKERRKALARLWTPDVRPPGCGVCLNLEDIDSIELESWCRSVQKIWQGEEGQLIAEIEPLFGNGKLPMLDAEQRVAPLLRRNIAGQG